MTPADLPTSPTLEEAHGLYVEHPVMYQAISALRLAQHRATLAWAAERLREKYATREIVSCPGAANFVEGLAKENGK